MPEAVFERYKEALKRGHVALQRGRLQEALQEYRAAAGRMAGGRKRWSFSPAWSTPADPIASET